VTPQESFKEVIRTLANIKYSYKYQGKFIIIYGYTELNKSYKVFLFGKYFFRRLLLSSCNTPESYSCYHLW